MQGPRQPVAAHSAPQSALPCARQTCLSIKEDSRGTAIPGGLTPTHFDFLPSRRLCVERVDEEADDRDAASFGRLVQRSLTVLTQGSPGTWGGVTSGAQEGTVEKDYG